MVVLLLVDHVFLQLILIVLFLLHIQMLLHLVVFLCQNKITFKIFSLIFHILLLVLSNVKSFYCNWIFCSYIDISFICSYCICCNCHCFNNRVWISFQNTSIHKSSWISFICITYYIFLIWLVMFLLIPIFNPVGKPAPPRPRSP